MYLVGLHIYILQNDTRSIQYQIKLLHIMPFIYNVDDKNDFVEVVKVNVFLQMMISEIKVKTKLLKLVNFKEECNIFLEDEIESVTTVASFCHRRARCKHWHSAYTSLCAPL